MLIKRSCDIASSEITPRATYLGRREFLAALVTLPIGGRMVTTTDAVTAKDAITSYTNYYEFGSDKGDAGKRGGAFKASPWSVAVEGLCAKPGTFTLEDILKPHPLEERIYRHRCVEGWSMVVPWDGFPLGNLLKRFEPSAKAKFVEFTTVNRPQEMPGIRRGVLNYPYVEGLRMDEAMHPLAILATGLYGESLLTQNGAPLRLVVPWKYGFKSIKSIVKIRFVEKQPLNTWQEANAYYYGFYANVNPDVATPSYSQATERRIGAFFMQRTLPFNGYAEQVASMYAGMDPKKLY
jgi:sulfoxide reductase catalytic subunit YedY